VANAALFNKVTPTLFAIHSTNQILHKREGYDDNGEQKIDTKGRGHTEEEEEPCHYTL
jgi:hypothetical protein